MAGELPSEVPAWDSESGNGKNMELFKAMR
jgi:hypothetical protein